MLIDFENIGYVKCDNILLPTESSYIPASTWGFIKGDITEQKDLIDLITNLEIGLTPEQIELLSNTSNIIDEFKTDYYTKREVDNIISNIEVGDVDLTGYATEQWVTEQGYLTEHQSLADYATKQWVLYNYYLKGDIDELLNDTKDDTKDWVTEQGYLAESTILTDYYTKSEIDDAFANIEIGITPEQIEIINNLDDKFAGIEYDLSELTSELGDKASADSVYTKDEIDSKHYATEQWVEDKGYLTEHQSLAGYATEQWVEDKGYLTEHQSLDNYYNKSEVDNIVSDNKVDLTGYATEQWVTDKGYLTEHQSLAGYATEQWVTDKGYLTEHQSLDNYYNKSETDNLLSNKLDTNLIWSGSQADWDALSTDVQAQYIIAMIQQ